MNKIKRIFAAVICLALLCAIPMQAMAATVTDLTTGEEGDVYAVYNSGNPSAAYSVNISWGSMQFSFDANEAWNDVIHDWEPKTPVWVALNSSNTITVQNNSSVAVTATFGFAVEATYNTTVTGGDFTSANNQAFSDTQDTLAMVAPSVGVEADTHTVSFMPTGTLPASVATSTKIGTITITLA